MPVTVAHHLPSLVTPTPLPSLSFRDTQCPPAAEAASYTDSKPCICAERQDPGGVSVSNTVNILLRGVGGQTNAPAQLNQDGLHGILSLPVG